MAAVAHILNARLWVSYERGDRVFNVTLFTDQGIFTSAATTPAGAYGRIHTRVGLRTVELEQYLKTKFGLSFEEVVEK